MTASNLNANFVQAATTNSTPTCIEGDSKTLAAMNATVDPFPSGTASLATSLEDEIQRLRFVLTRMHGATNWYTETQFSLGHGAGRLSLVSATSIQFCPFNGNMFRIPSTAKTYQIPNACWTAANTSVYVAGVASSNLAASTTYWVYLFDLSGTPTFDFYTSSTHTADSLTGIEIRTSDNTRVLIGMVRTNASSQFEDDNALRGVVSWLNRRPIGLVNNFTAARTTASTTYVELNSEIRGNFLTWADSAVSVYANVSSQSATLNASQTNSIGFDGTTAENTGSQAAAFATNIASSGSFGMVKNGLTEGFHFVTLLGAVSAGTGSWAGGTAGTILASQAGVPCSIAVGISG